MSDNDDRRARIQQAWDAAWDRGEVDAFDELLSPDYRRIGSAHADQDLTEFKASIIATRSAFPDLVTTVDEVVIKREIVQLSAGTAPGFTSIPSSACRPPSVRST